MRRIIAPGDRIVASFGRLRWATHADTLPNHVLHVLGEAASAAARRLADLEVEGEWWDVEYEGELLETLLGSMFVVWQTYLTAMVSATLQLDAATRSELGLRLSIVGGKVPRRKVLGFGTPTVDRTGHTGPEIVDAFANYFKHRDEWPDDWQMSEDSRGRYTAGVVRACGAAPECEENLRRGMETLGVQRPYADFSSVGECLIAWVSAIEPQLRSEIESTDSRYVGRL